MRTYTDTNPCPTAQTHDAPWAQEINEALYKGHTTHHLADIARSMARAISANLPDRDYESAPQTKEEQDRDLRAKRTRAHLHAIANRLDAYAARLARTN